MYYEVTIRHDMLTDKNQVKSQSDKIIVSNVNLFAEAECKALEYAASERKADNLENEPDVTFIKRSRIMEFANTKDKGEKIYIAKLDCLSIDVGSGNEKHIKYSVGIYADDITQANSACQEYMRQGMTGLTLTDLNETKFLSVIE